MTRSTLPPEPEVPESTVSELHALYHEGSKAEPGLMLDRSILDAARAEVRADRATKRQTRWWKNWLPVTSVIAVAVIGLSVTWRVMDEQERHLREEMSAAGAANETAGRAVPAERPADAKPSLDATAPAAEKSRRVESRAVKDAAVGVPEPAAMSAPATPATMAPAPAEQALKKESRRAETDELRERRDAGAAANSASGPARQSGKLEAGSLGTASSGEAAADSVARPSAKSVAAPAIDAATPDAWLKYIRELRAAGRSADAAQSLARFRARYPDLVLPDDLLNLK